MTKSEEMENALFKKVEIVSTDGQKHIGKVKGFESAYDNDDENEASIYLKKENGEWVGFFESDIESISIL